MAGASPTLETVLATPRLKLRAATLTDAAFFLALLNDPSWLENIGDRGVRSAAEAERYIRDNVQAPYRSLGYGMYVVGLKATGQPIGVCGLLRRDFLPGPDLGFALLPQFAGCGYASEAARAVLGYAQGTLGVGQLYAIVKRGNQRSVRLLGGLGFRHQGPCANPQGGELELYVTT
jgi:ribosomal-protein-alanine N-acetyltransferase